MALKAGRRPELGERIAAGDVRPVSNRLLLWMSIGVVVLVTLAITAIIVASNGTKFSKVIDNNTPHQTPSATASP